MKLTPLSDRVVIDPIESDGKTKSGLYLPEDAKEKPQTGKVVSVGSGAYQNGTFVSTVLTKGDIVLFPRYSGVEITLNENKFIVLREGDILAIVGK